MPTTHAGKAIAARNATTHGLFARDIVLPALGEDPGAYDALLARFTQQLTPRTLLERHYVEQIACASWRLRRLHRWQAQVYEDPALDEDQRLNKLDRVLRHETCLTRQIDRAVQMLGRDLTPLTDGCARRSALLALDATELECQQDPDLASEVQQKVAETLSPDGANVDFDLSRLDNTQICQNELEPETIDEESQSEPDDDLDKDVSVTHPGGRPVYLTKKQWYDWRFQRNVGDYIRAEAIERNARHEFLARQRQRQQDTD